MTSVNYGFPLLDLHDIFLLKVLNIFYKFSLLTVYIQVTFSSYDVVYNGNL